MRRCKRRSSTGNNGALLDRALEKQFGAGYVNYLRGTFTGQCNGKDTSGSWNTYDVMKPGSDSASCRGEWKTGSESPPSAPVSVAAVHGIEPIRADDELKRIRAAAEAGDAGAQAAMACRYRDAQGVSQDLAEALKWFRLAAAQGDAFAEYCLAMSYSFGTGVAKDDDEAMVWLRKSADHGFARAQASIGYRYLIGSGVAKNPVKAAMWSRLAADQGYDKAQYNLALQYELGNGVEKSRAEAVKWFQKAAAQGHAESRQWLAEHDLMR